MTEQDRQQNVARVLYALVAELTEFRSACDKLQKRVGQMAALAGEFETGRYLKDTTDATGHDDPPSGPGESTTP